MGDTDLAISIQALLLSQASAPNDVCLSVALFGKLKRSTKERDVHCLKHMCVSERGRQAELAFFNLNVTSRAGCRQRKRVGLWITLAREVF